MVIHSDIYNTFFYDIIKTIIKNNDNVLDLGCGLGDWGIQCL